MNLLKYVNIDIGTDSEYRESNGNTLPNVQYPFGNQSYIFQSNKNDNGWFYKPRANYTEGIRVSNQPSPWLGDYGHITLLPFNGNYDVDLHTSLSGKKHGPNKLSCYLDRYKIAIDLVPTKIGACLKIKSESNKDTKLLIDCFKEDTTYTLRNNTLIITNTNVPEDEYSGNYRKYYALKFDCEINSVDEHEDASKLEIALSNSSFRIDLTSSYISEKSCFESSEKQSILLYEDLSTDITQKWEKYLQTVEVEEELSSEQLEIFYSNLYRTMCYPRIISEINSGGEEVYYNFKNCTIDKGSMITDVGFWDTYRTTMPLYKIILPTMYKVFADSILNYYKSYGWLPRWLAPYERGIMPSTLVDSIVADAIITDVYDSKQIDIAVEGLLKNADTVSKDKLFGREHLADYLKYGYVPANCPGESVSLSLDNFYSDYAIYKALNKINHKEASRFEGRCNQYQKLFNKKTKFFERCDEEGKFDPDFNPADWGFDFCESSAYQNNLNIFHSVEGMIELFGSKEQVEEKLDMLFSAKPEYTVGRYGFEIHEMTEYSRIKDLGHFAISNQPSFNIPFWYLHIDKDEKFYNVIKKTLKHFTTDMDGYPGDEDNGSLAAWYVLVNLGMYPFCPVDGMIEFDSKFKFKINKI